MFSMIFEPLREKGRKFDEGISELVETWKMPSVLVGGYGECSDETVAYSKEIWASIKNIQDGIESISTREEALTEDKDDFEEFLQKSKATYEDLKSQCDELDNMLQQYGYHYEDNNVTNCNTETLEVEFTPELSWKRKSKPGSQLITDCPSHLQMAETLITPLKPKNKMVTSVAAMNTPTMKGSKGIYSPIQDCPQRSIYSKQYYSTQKKL